jgi:hypothetical protein
MLMASVQLRVVLGVILKASGNVRGGVAPRAGPGVKVRGEAPVGVPGKRLTIGRSGGAGEGT